MSSLGGVGIAALVVATGCSWIVDPDRYRHGGVGGDDGGPPADGGPADATPPDASIDAEPGSLQVTDLSPDEVDEGLGAAGAPIAILFTGLNIDDTTEVTSNDTRVEIVGPTLIAADGTALATAIRVAVDDRLDADATDAIELRLTRDDDGTDGVALTIRGLDELTLAAGDLAVTGTTFDARYSTIRVSGAASLRGNQAAAARLTATASIAIDAALDADGRTNAGAAGGCVGGAAGQPGGCTTGGGGAGVTGVLGSGGGGGGHAEDGVGGTGTGGDGGGDVGEPLLVPIGASGTRGNGGGGGGGGTTGAGGHGGAGGGVIVLDSLGTIAIDAAVRARGGAGGGAGGTCTIEGGGGGGGGSGGALLVRALGGLTATGGSVDVAGGAGEDRGGSCNDGGAGAAGRIRIDAPAAALPGGLGGADDAARGPVWDPAAPVVTDDLTYTITLYGGANQDYGVYVGGGAIETVTTAPAGSIEVELTLVAGLNTICAVARPDLSSFPQEAQTCRAIVAVP
jgi:hypothetical protein